MGALGQTDYIALCIARAVVHTRNEQGNQVHVMTIGENLRCLAWERFAAHIMRFSSPLHRAMHLPGDTVLNVRHIDNVIRMQSRDGNTGAIYFIQLEDAGFQLKIRVL